jgi:hypothetical protein
MNVPERFPDRHDSPDEPDEGLHLRGHHLLCLQSYRGEGYERPFVENLERVLRTFEESPAIVVEGADDVCSACPSLAEGRCADPAGGEDEIRRLDRLACDLLELRAGGVVDATYVRTRSREVWNAWREGACDGCAWENVCGGGGGRSPDTTPRG